MERRYTKEQIKVAIRETFKMDESKVGAMNKDKEDYAYSLLFSDFFENLDSQINGS